MRHSTDDIKIACTSGKLIGHMQQMSWDSVESSDAHERMCSLLTRSSAPYSARICTTLSGPEQA